MYDVCTLVMLLHFHRSAEGAMLVCDLQETERGSTRQYSVVVHLDPLLRTFATGRLVCHLLLRLRKEMGSRCCGQARLGREVPTYVP
ncbi:hypothetical protein V8F06_002997, partial [Rhypophila decipiens]